MFPKGMEYCLCMEYTRDLSFLHTVWTRIVPLDIYLNYMEYTHDLMLLYMVVIDKFHLDSCQNIVHKSLLLFEDYNFCTVLWDMEWLNMRRTQYLV
jgi:hypothetical protein